MKIVILAVLVSILVISLSLSTAEAREVSPFDFQLDESAVDGKRYSYLTGTGPAAIIKQNETKSLPIIILSATDKPIPVKFHVTVGNNQTGPIQMPLGVHATVEPSDITIKSNQNQTINIIVNADKNAPDGKYALNIVGEWPEKNGFMGSSIVINIGKDFGPDMMPFNFQWTPLKQYQSGKDVKDIQCDQGLQLVIKSEDKTPACVKPGHLARLAQYGWTIPNLKIIGDTDITNNYGLSENDCGQFYTIPANKSNFNTIPVLILKQNSTGCAKITFTVNFLFNNTNDCIGCNSQMVKIAKFLSIGKYNFSRYGDLISGSSGKDYTHSFQITAVPKTVDISRYPVGSNFTAVFIIKPLPNATGFYDYSIVKPVCNAYPLAVGYSSDQVNSSDFSKGLDFMQNHPCVMGSYGISQVQVSGIDYVQMKLD
ncbi:MAG TPA: hypothetical protein VGR54_09460 [Nitrosopumilaceae archaeon]|nr:hypothetical protein [Nitrosopumilaceae archaeon]